MDNAIVAGFIIGLVTLTGGLFLVIDVEIKETKRLADHGLFDFDGFRLLFHFYDRIVSLIYLVLYESNKWTVVYQLLGSRSYPSTIRKRESSWLCDFSCTHVSAFSAFFS